MLAFPHNFIVEKIYAKSYKTGKNNTGPKICSLEYESWEGPVFLRLVGQRSLLEVRS